jgi:sigma-E factor negative regulatory protein RseA
MSDRPDQVQRRQQLSALMDGDLGHQDASGACKDWRDDDQLRVTWHAYHLIGDVLRSDDLAQPAARDEAFLVSLRSRLAQEPVVMAPAAAYVAPKSATAVSASARKGRRRLMGSLAVAAGFAAVAGVLVVMQMSAPETGLDSGATMASQGNANAPVRVVALPGADTASSAPAASGSEGTLIRNEQLDRYLADHRQYGHASAFVPGGAVRGASMVSPQR